MCSIMDDTVNVDQDAASGFWDRYINIHMDQCVKGIFGAGTSSVLSSTSGTIQMNACAHSSRHIEQFFTDLGRDSRISDWQIRQTVDAIRILFCELLHSEPCAAVDWKYWSEASLRLAPSHATLARDSVGAQISDSD
jgi:hypothetical protein